MARKLPRLRRCGISSCTPLSCRRSLVPPCTPSPPADGVMETAEKIKPRKAAPAPPPAPAPKPPRPAAAPRQAPAPKRPAPAPPRRLVEPAPTAAARLHGSSSGGSVSTFAAEQERQAREAARREEEERREAARVQWEQREAERLSRLGHQYDEQIAALTGNASEGGSSWEGGEASGAPWGAPEDLLLPLPVDSPGIGTPELSHQASAAGSLPALDAVAPDPGGVVWLPEPQFEREAGADEEVDELLALMGIS